MSLFKRLTNVAKGQAKVLAKDAKQAWSELTEGEEREEVRLSDPQPTTRPAATVDDRLELLERLRQDAMISDEKYALKKAELEAERGEADRAEPVDRDFDGDGLPDPMKRTL